MILKDISLGSPLENIVYDEVLLYLSESGARGAQLRFWESPVTFIVMGKISKEENDLNMESVLRDRVPVLRRSSGGGTVLQGKGCLNYSIIIDKNFHPGLSDIGKSYRFVLSKIVDALATMNIKAAYQPISDIALVDGLKKFSGNAQKRGKRCILHHGTLLYDFDLDLMEKYLSFPLDVPAYREGRSHREFVTNLCVNPAGLKQAIVRQFSVERTSLQIDQQEKVLLEQMSASKNITIALTDG